MDEFLDRVEEFLEAGAHANTMTHSNLFNVFIFGYDEKTLTMVSNHDEPSIAIFGDEMHEIPDDFISHVLDTLKPTEIEIKKC